MVVAAAPDTEESWENIESLLAELDIESLSACPFAVDMKVQLILLGKQTGASKHNCPYGHGFAPFNSCPLITLKNLDENYQAFQAAGGCSTTVSGRPCFRVILRPKLWSC